MYSPVRPVSRALASAVLLTLWTPLAFGQVTEPRDPTLGSRVAPRRVAADASSESVIIAARGGSGLGIFQDIQVPVNELAGQRGDGKASGEENADHAGFPIYAGIGVDYKVGSWRYDMVSFEALQMRATTGPAETQSSSYSRLDLRSGASYAMAVGEGLIGTFGADLGIRRSSFNNVSSSHYIEAALVGGRVAVSTAGWTLALFGRVAPVARFGYSEDSVLGGKPFGDSSASLKEVGGQLAFNIAPRVMVDTGFEYESAVVSVNDVSRYNDFGLAVFDSSRPDRKYALATYVLRLGIRKEF